MKQPLLILGFLLCMAQIGYAQSAEDSVKMVISKLFDAMKKSDSALLNQCFSPTAIMQTIRRDKEGVISVVNDSVEKFAQSIHLAPAGALDERITFDLVKIDGPLAFAWTPYSFYYNGQFSHCGVNAFQLVRHHNGWKIQYIIDTRRKKDCL